MDVKLDILVLAVHPDDAELACAGTIMKHIDAGYKVGIVDLTQGELGTRGSVKDRYQEAADSSEILGLTCRANLKLRDGFLQNAEEEQMAIIRAIRRFRPEIVICNAVDDRHPDHGRSSKLESDACFLSGLRKIATFWNEEAQQEWRPKAIHHYLQDRFIKPDFVVDITPYWERKLASIKAYKTQFFNPDLDEPQTYISGENYIKFLEARALEMGHFIGTKYGEGFTVERMIRVENLFDIV